MRRIIIHIIGVGAALLLGGACARDEGPPSTRALIMSEQPAWHLSHSNVTELEGADILVTAEEVDGDTRITVAPVEAWPIVNEFLGFDKLYYGAKGELNPVIRIADEGCDEPVVRGEACGWTVNTDGCVADGFGCLLSHSNASSAGHGGRTAPLVFTLAGRADLQPNDHGATFVLHARFGGDKGCSGWFSDGLPDGVGSDPGCEAAPPPPSCALTVTPDHLSLLPGDSVEAVVLVEGTAPVELQVTAQPPLGGMTYLLIPNPVTPPGAGTLRVDASSSAVPGETVLTVYGFIAQPGVRPATCETSLSLRVLPEPPPVCTCP